MYVDLQFLLLIGAPKDGTPLADVQTSIETWNRLVLSLLNTFCLTSVLNGIFDGPGWFFQPSKLLLSRDLSENWKTNFCCYCKIKKAEAGTKSVRQNVESGARGTVYLLTRVEITYLRRVLSHSRQKWNPKSDKCRVITPWLSMKFI